MSTYDPEARIAALGERVDNQGNRLTQIENAMSRGFAAVESSLAANRSASDASLAALATELRTGAKPQWQALSLMATVIIFVLGAGGTLVYMPIVNSLTELKGEVRSDRRDAVSVEAFQNFRQLYDGNRTAYRVDVDNQFKRVDETLKAQVPRGELEREWRNADQRFTDVQRQIDDMKKFQADLVSAPNYLKGLDERMRMIESRLTRPNP